MLLRLQAVAGNRAVGQVLARSTADEVIAERAFPRQLPGRSAAARPAAQASSARPRTRVLARTPPSESLDLLGSAGSWYEGERARLAELEAAETGEGRRRTLTRLAAMTDRDARREAPGIAYRAQDRGDVELATTASGRLLAAWLASSDAPATLSAGFGPDDAVDIVLDRADRALGDGQSALGGNFLAVAMVQLVRAARAAV